MKTIGLIGGITWVSTIEYYSVINSEFSKRLGGNNSANIIMHSVNFGEYKQLADEGNWQEIGTRLNGIAKKLESAGADLFIICSNTPHRVAPDVIKGINIPFIHIAEVTAKEIAGVNLKKVGLLGTKFTMEEQFYKEKLAEHQIETVIPEAGEREFIHNSIFNELAKNIFKDETRSAFIKIINNLIAKGAQGIILGCTEIPLLIKQEDSSVPVFDTTLIHAHAAVELALT